MQRPALQKCIAVALALLEWQGAAMAVGLDLLLPSYQFLDRKMKQLASAAELGKSRVLTQ